MERLLVIFGVLMVSSASLSLDRGMKNKMVFPDNPFLSGTSPSTISVGKRSNLDLVNEDMAYEEDVPDYPYEEIRRLLESSPYLKLYFKPIPVIGNRDGGFDADGDELCSTRTSKVIHPRKMRNVNNVERFIVNQDDYKQAIEQTQCAHNGSCSGFPFGDFGLIGTCHQKYDSKQLWIYKESNKLDNSSQPFALDSFRLPSCCVCKLKKKTNP